MFWQLTEDTFQNGLLDAIDADGILSTTSLT